jgi:ketosteroid isomerase-like protein
MAQENVEIVQRLYQAWRENGFGVVPELMDAEIEYVNPPYAVEPGTRHGHDGFAAAARSLLEVYTDYDVSEARLRAVGDRVVVTATVTTRSRANAIPIGAERGYVFDVRDGKITRFEWFNDPAEALASVGLEE